MNQRYLFILPVSMLLFSFGFSPKDKWISVEYKQHGFKISYPGVPVEKKEVLQDEQLKNPVVYYYNYEPSPMLHDANTSYNICLTAYPPLTAEMEQEPFRTRFYNSLLQDVFNTGDNRLLTKKKIKIGKYSGIEGVADNEHGKNIITVRIFLIENKLFQLSTLTPAANKKNKLIGRFMNSFDLTE